MADTTPSELSRRIDAENHAGGSGTSFPPPGWVDRDRAAALLGIRRAALDLWLRKGRFGYAGILAVGKNGVRCRIYDVAELKRAREEMIAAEEAAGQLPEGYLDFDGVAAFFGVHPGTVNEWQQQGRLSRGTWTHVPGRNRKKVFAIAELERVREQMKIEAEQPTAPDGFVELHHAIAMLGIGSTTFYTWERQGRIKQGQAAPIPGTSARTKIYPIEEIRRVSEEIRIAAENFPPEGWIDIKEAARRANVSVHVWKKWMADGRVGSGRWVIKPTGGRCKLFSVEEVEQLVEELGRDHLFFLEADGNGNWTLPAGYLDRQEAARMFGVAESTLFIGKPMGALRADDGREGRQESPGRRQAG